MCALELAETVLHSEGTENPSHRGVQNASRRVSKTADFWWRLLHRVCLLFTVGATQAAAQVSGPCSECHTMHNSQDGSSVTVPSGVWPALTKAGCGPCHNGLNDGANTTPFVWGSGAVYGQTGTETGTNTLAGGTFQFVTQDDPGNAYGYNVIRPQQPDSRLVEPPGFVDGFDDHGQVSPNWQTNRLSCQGLYGCHGLHVDDKGVAGAHHADDTPSAICAPAVTEHSTALAVFRRGCVTRPIST